MEGALLMSGRKPFDKAGTEKRIRAEFNRAHNYISMFNHAALQGGEEYYNNLQAITHPTLIIHGTDDVIWHFDHAKVLLKEIQHATMLLLEGTGHQLHSQDWTKIIEAIASHVRLHS
jgi:pimeloyl-ACP methyl ester carboxylesterase